MSLECWSKQGWWCCFWLAIFYLLYCCKTYHGDRVDRVQDGKQQDVVLRKVPIGIICKLCIMWFVFSNSCIKKTNVCFFIMWTACLKQIIKIMFLTCIVCVYVAWQCLAGGYLWSFGDYIGFPLTSIFTLRVNAHYIINLLFLESSIIFIIPESTFFPSTTSSTPSASSVSSTKPIL